MVNFQASLSQWMDITIDIAQQAGSILKNYLGNLDYIENKNYRGDLVTEADKQSEKLIIQALKKAFPDHLILAEESGQVKNNIESDYLWIVDPLDGTTNYAHQYPLFAVSIGLTYQGQPILGVIYNPLTDELYMSAQNQGAYLNGQQIKVSTTSNLENSLLGTGFAYDRRETLDNNYAEFCYLTHLTQGVRRGGAASLDLAYVACGRLDGYWEKGLKPWDMAAGIIILQEAGGWVSDYNLNAIDLNAGRILATNGLLQHSLSQSLLQAKEKITLTIH